jgi:transcriptional regulator GlxA family with amidase domain
MSLDAAMSPSQQPSTLGEVLRLLSATLAEFDLDPDVTRDRVFRAASLLGLGARADRPVGPSSQPLSGRAARLVVDHIRDHLDGPIRIAHLAGLIGISSSQFSRSFKTSYGVSAHKYITEQRLLHATTMMRTTDLPLSEIALASGLCDQSHLCTLFRRHFGEAPSRWRRQHAAP